MDISALDGKRPPHFATDLTADHPLPTSKGGNLNTKNSWSIVVLAIVQNKAQSKCIRRDQGLCILGKVLRELAKNDINTQIIESLVGVGQKC